jgi:predicted lipid carrier protein YhbT
MSPADRADIAASTPRLPRPVSMLISRLPQFPHSLGLALSLNLLLRPLLTPENETALRGRIIAIEVDDAGIDFRVRLGSFGFAPLRGVAPAEVTFRATAYDYYLMARRLEDPDTLFFNRRLRIEGNTELGLIVKNSLDAIDWQGLPAQLRTLLDRAAAFLKAIAGRAAQR